MHYTGTVNKRKVVYQVYGQEDEEYIIVTDAHIQYRYDGGYYCEALAVKADDINSAGRVPIYSAEFAILEPETWDENGNRNDERRIDWAHLIEINHTGAAWKVPEPGEVTPFEYSYDYPWA